MSTLEHDRFDDFARDVLIGRVVDGEACPDDWKALADLAARDQRVWAELAGAQRQHDALTRAVDRAVAPADGVEMPDFTPHANPAQHRLRLASSWGGWAAAAVVILAWTTGLELPTGSIDGAPAQTAGFVRIGDSPEAALDRYLDAGRATGTVVREIPDRVVYETRPLESGGVEVLYLRQILERRIVDEVYRRAADEFGRSVELPVERPAPALSPGRTSAF